MDNLVQQVMGPHESLGKGKSIIQGAKHRSPSAHWDADKPAPVSTTLYAMKTWAHIVLVSIFMLLVGCAEDARSLFVTLVFPDDTIAKDILVKKIECMHCPTYFRFQTNSSGKKAILNYQSMHRIDKPTTGMESVLYLPKAKWWPSNTEIDNMEKYWIEYPGADSSEAPFFRMALISENTVYFVSKGGNWIRDKKQ